MAVHLLKVLIQTNHFRLSTQTQSASLLVDKQESNAGSDRAVSRKGIKVSPTQNPCKMRKWKTDLVHLVAGEDRIN